MRRARWRTVDKFRWPQPASHAQWRTLGSTRRTLPPICANLRGATIRPVLTPKRAFCAWATTAGAGMLHGDLPPGQHGVRLGSSAADQCVVFRLTLSNRRLLVGASASPSRLRSGRRHHYAPALTVNVCVTYDETKWAISLLVAWNIAAYSAAVSPVKASAIGRPAMQGNGVSPN